jgi:hypothetical protein
MPVASRAPLKPLARAVAEAFGTGSAAPGRLVLPPALVDKRRKRAQGRIVDALKARGAKTLPRELSEEIGALARRWAEQDFDDGFKDAASFELRCFEERELAGARAGDAVGVVEAAYRRAILEDYGKIEIRGLQMSERVYQDLDVAYVPLWIQDDSQEAEVIRAGEGIELRTIPRLRVPELLGKHERAVLVGAPGSGKSTIVAWLAAHAASRKLNGFAGAESVVPFVVAVRSLQGSRLDAEAIAAGARGIDAGFVRQVLDERRGLVLVDGLDEAHEGAAVLVPALQAFVEAYPGNRILVTTRPAGTIGSERVEIAGFASTTLTPMSREDVYEFIGKWCEVAELSIQKDRVKATEDGRRAAEDLEARVRASRPVERLAQTPLVCSVLCIVHRFLGQRIPERRAALYEACTNVLLYEWDRAKFPAGAAIGQLDAQEKKVLLGGLARWMHEAKVAEVPREEVVRQFAERLPWMKREPGEAEGIVREIQDRSGILVERRPGFFAFSHLTFQEYLTAVELVRAGELLELVPRSHDRWWHEVTVLAAGLPGADAAQLILGLLSSGSHGILLSAQCVETSIHLASSVRKVVEERLAELVPPRSDQDVERLVRVGDVAGPVLRAALRGADATGRAYICVALGRLGYEPAAGVLARLMLDEVHPDVKGVPILYAIGEMPMGFVADGHPVATFAALALFNMSVFLVSIRPVFERALRDASHDATYIFSSFFISPYVNDVGPVALGYLSELSRLARSPAQGSGLPKPSASSG